MVNTPNVKLTAGSDLSGVYGTGNLRTLLDKGN